MTAVTEDFNIIGLCGFICAYHRIHTGRHADYNANYVHMSLGLEKSREKKS